MALKLVSDRKMWEKGVQLFIWQTKAGTWTVKVRCYQVPWEREDQCIKLKFETAGLHSMGAACKELQELRETMRRELSEALAR